MSKIRGIRGAITVVANTKTAILSATSALLKKMISMNAIRVEDVASVIFSVTGDLDADFPAHAARKIGWKTTPLLCVREVDVPGAMKKCVRILMHVNSEKPQSGIKHVYLGGASKLRPDLR